MPYLLVDGEVRCQTAGSITAGQCGGHIGIAEETGNLLCHITHSVDVLTEGGCGNGQCIAVDLCGQLDSLQDRLHFLGSQGEADEIVDLLHGAGHHRGLPLYRVNVNDAAHHFAGVQLLYQLAGTVDGPLSEVRIQALLEVSGGVGSVADLSCGEADVGAVKGSRLENHGLHIVGDLRVLAAHDAGHADGTLCVADGEHGMIQLPLLLVQSLENIAVLCPLHDDLVTADQIVVIGMHRLAVLKHHIVGDVHQVVDGTNAGGGQTHLHPLR